MIICVGPRGRGIGRAGGAEQVSKRPPSPVVFGRVSNVDSDGNGLVPASIEWSAKVKGRQNLFLFSEYMSLQWWLSCSVTEREKGSTDRGKEVLNTRQEIKENN